MHLSHLTVLLSMALIFGCADSEDGQDASINGIIPENGETYTGGQRIFLDQYGLGFQIPAGWSGQYDEGVFGLTNAAETAAGMVTAVRISSAELEAAMDERMEVSEGVFMVQEGSVTRSGNSFTSSYDITGEQDGSSWKGYIAATVGAFEWTSVALGLSPSGERDAMADAMDDINASVELEAPHEGADFFGSWEDALKGYTFTFYDSGSDYSDKTTFTLCSDGSASYSSSSYSGGITGSLSTNSMGSGSWQLEQSSASSADVYFELSNDLSGTREFSVDGEGKYYIGDMRYFRSANDC